MYKYSFIIPSYNNLAGLRRCLNAIEQVQVPRRNYYEIIVVDDGSNDGTAKALASKFEKCNYTYLYLERSNISCRSRARNAGLKAALGEFVVFVDSDVMVYPGHLLQLDRYFDQSLDFLVVGNRVFLEDNAVDSHGDSQNCPRADVDFRYQIYRNRSFNMRAVDYPWAPVYSCNMAIKAQTLRALGGFDEHFVDWGLEDVDLGYRCWLYGVQVCVNPFLEVLHQGADSRDDLLGGGERLLGYKGNIEYFINKYPSIANMPRKEVFDLLITGEEQCRPALDYSAGPIEYFVHQQGSPSLLMAEVLAASARGCTVVILDHTTNSNLDVWVHSENLCKPVILYYPLWALNEEDRRALLADSQALVMVG